jgi:hypothetical protein
MCCAACTRTETIKPFAYLSIKFVEDEEYVLMERIECIWEPDKKEAHLTAYGFKNERLTIDLPDLKQTGRYTDLSIKNFFYTDGVDFMPVRVDSGFIDITQMDASQIGGSFSVTLEDEYNGVEHRTVTGNFVIYAH